MYKLKCFVPNLRSLRYCLEYHVMEQGTVEACHWADCGHQFSADDDISVSIGNRMNASAFRDLWARVMF